MSRLWGASGDLDLSRGRHLGRDDIRRLLRGPAVRVAVADVGSPLRWVAPGEVFRFWKEDAAPRIAEPGPESQRLDDFPGGYYYRASEWSAGSCEPALLFEKSH